MKIQSNRPSPHFGGTPADTMLVQNYAQGQWGSAKVVPFADLTLSPLTRGLHYGQSIFEGIKAYRQPDGEVAMFRPDMHIDRFAKSAARMCMPDFDQDALIREIASFVGSLAGDCPDAPGSLYVRPLLLATDTDLLPEPSEQYTLMVLAAPVGTYKIGQGGLRVCTSSEFTRAAPGGTGAVKCAGNYAGTMLAKRQAAAAGFDEVLWLDAAEGRWIEETGSMNVMVVRDGTLLTPPGSDTILTGVTRLCLLELADRLGIPNEIARISTDPADWIGVTEVFSAGTALSTKPIWEVRHGQQSLFASKAEGPIQRALSLALGEQHFGRSAFDHGWRHPCPSPNRFPATPAWASA